MILINLFCLFLLFCFFLKILNASPSSGLVQIDPKLAQDAPCESPKVSDVAIVRSGSKGTSERKTRRPSAKAMGKESARKGNPIKDTASVRLEKGAKTNNVSPCPSRILQHVQSNEALWSCGFQYYETICSCIFHIKPS